MCIIPTEKQDPCIIPMGIKHRRTASASDLYSAYLNYTEFTSEVLRLNGASTLRYQVTGHLNFNVGRRHTLFQF